MTFTATYSVAMLRIVRCSDAMRWYRGMVGQLLPYNGWHLSDGYKSKEPSGHTNFVLTQDAELVEIQVPASLLVNWPFNYTRAIANHQSSTTSIPREMSVSQWREIVQSLLKQQAGSSHEPVKTTSQTRKQSAIESVVNVAIGWLISLGVTAVVLPAFGHKVTMEENVYMTSIFTIVSLVRSYAVRRYFNYIHSQKKEQL